MSREVSKLYVFDISYLDSWASDREKPVVVREQYDIEKKTPKTYITSRGVSIRKVRINEPVVGCGGVIKVITTKPYFEEKLYNEIKELVEKQYNQLKADISMCELTLNRLPKFKEGDIFA